MEGYNSSFTGAQIDEAVRKVINGESADMATVQEYADTHWLGKEIFPVNVTKQKGADDDDVYTTDKQFDEIRTAVDNGKTVYAIYDGRIFPLVMYTSSLIKFGNSDNGISTNFIIKKTSVVGISLVGQFTPPGGITLSEGTLNLAQDPKTDMEAATKKYVDEQIAALRNELMQQG